MDCGLELAGECSQVLDVEDVLAPELFARVRNQLQNVVVLVDEFSEPLQPLPECPDGVGLPPPTEGVFQKVTLLPYQSPFFDIRRRRALSAGRHQER